MTALPGIALGPLAGLAIKFPVAAVRLLGFGKFMKAHWKETVIGLALVGTVTGGYLYVQHVKHESYTAGVKAQFDKDQALVVAANTRAAKDNEALGKLQVKFNGLSTQRQQQVKIVTQTKIERIHDEVQSNPVYRQCSVTVGMLDYLQDLVTTVNGSIRSGEH